MSKTCNGCEGHEKEPSIAMDVLTEAKVKEKRWFVMAMVELFMIFAIFLSIIYFFMTTDIIYTDVDAGDGGHANYIENSTTGDINNGPNQSEEIKTEKQQTN